MMKIPHRYADDLYDDLWRPEETRETRARVRDFAEREVRAVAHALNNTPETVDAFPRKPVTQMASAGLFRIPFAGEYGGAGLQFPTLATMVMLEEISYLSSGLAASMIDVQLIWQYRQAYYFRMS
jgi:alkylation response protein AidB-like acyl-CoA dehydrogenase